MIETILIHSFIHIHVQCMYMGECVCELGGYVLVYVCVCLSKTRVLHNVMYNIYTMY